MTPLSEAGKVFCLVFALIGIPMTLVLLTAFVERLMVPSTVALQVRDTPGAWPPRRLFPR